MEGCEEKAKYTTEEEEEEEVSSTTVVYTTTEIEDCGETTYGCCPDGVSVAQGEFFKGCDIIEEDCNKSFYKCCPDGVTSAQGPNYQGCVTECQKSSFGCCDDGITPAHGYNKEGCCLSSTYGCCPDNIKPAEGPKQEGCGCEYSAFGCCPDNKTPALGSNYEGCGCQYTEHGCCPDNNTPAKGADYDGCACHTFQFGCCPDGVTIATGSRNQGCGCAYTEFGCCSDEKTAARGPNFAGCDCVSSKYGCCPDGETEAQGKEFEGCTDIPENLQENCQLAKDRGTCRNYTVKWFYDMEYGGCSRFWYGGCDGNGNRFKTKEECHNICVEPVGKDRCKLPKVEGPCEGYYPQWYYDKNHNHCTQFIYGGCLGNNNRFETREECTDLCVTDRIDDVCEQPKEEGPCHGGYINWYYNKDTGYCEQFVYGGCKGNANNFKTEAACKQRCAPADQQKLKERCQKPAETGDCSNYVSRYYYDTKDKICKHFYFGGCGGNDNNFVSESDCQAVCVFGLAATEAPPLPVIPEVTQGPEPFEIEYCYLPPEAGPCVEAETRWYYSNDGSCKQFRYGGCGGNQNNFKSSDECSRMCSSAEDVCNLPMTIRSCHGDYVSWYYNQTTDTCMKSDHGGCMSHGNKFDDLDSCERRCKKTPATQAPPEVRPTFAPDDPSRVCLKMKEVGGCNDTIESYYYDPFTRKCTSFTYSGCGGNENRFPNSEACDRYCGEYRGQDVCKLPSDSGPCRAYEPRFYYDKYTKVCKEFIYGGCGGNGNRFVTLEECKELCVKEEERVEELPIRTTAGPPSTAEAPHPPPHTPEPEPEQPEMCRQYQEECSNLRCQYGMKGYVENLCNRCKCVDPCEDVACPEGTRCEVELNRNHTDTSELSHFIGVCREINKPGDCPYIRGSGDECREDCRDDAHCVMDLKCCSNGCGHVCLMPTMTTLAPPGELRTTEGYLPGYTQGPPIRDTYPPEVIQGEFKPVVTAGEGDYATLRCAVRGKPKPVFTWSKDNVFIDGKEPRYRILLEGAALQIISLYKTDAGIYLCSADNSIGKPLKKEIRLDVIVPVRANITLTNTNFPVGSDVSIPCDVDGHPAPTVQWFKDDKPLYPSHNILITESHRLIIKNATESDSGEYRCAAGNQYSNASSTIPLLIQGRFIHPSCKDNPFFANCPLIIKANFCSHKYYARFCCRSCTEAGMLPSVGPHLGPDSVQNDLA